MSTWTEIEGSPNYVKGNGMERTLTRSFQTDFGAGITEAAARGYMQGSLVLKDDMVLYLTRIMTRNANGGEVVDVIWENVTPEQAQGGSDLYNDGVHRVDGEEEWYFEAATDTEIITYETRDFLNGEHLLLWGGDNYKEGDELLAPSVMLVWRKWMSRPGLTSIIIGHFPRTLPKTKEDCLAALATYLPLETGSYETGGPKIGARLGATGMEKKFLCVDVGLEADGNLVCRTARYKYTRDPDGWLSPPYI